MTALVTFLCALAISYVGTWLLLRLRVHDQFVDVPNARSSHETPKPRLGGIAIVSAFLVTFGVVMMRSADASFLPLIAGVFLVFVVGVFDDKRGLPIWLRFGAQAAAAAIVIASGHVVHHMQLPLIGTLHLGPLAVPFTAIFIMAAINFYNFVDGIDGLAAGGAFIAASFLALIAFMLGHVQLALACLAVAGATAGFLQFNFPPSRLFMGDSGSTVLGFFFAYVAVAGNQLQPPLPFFIPVLILSSLYLDAGVTLVRRALRGEKIFQAHKIHYYQRLLSLGLNHKQVTVIEYALTVLLGVSAVIYFKADGFFPAFLMLCWAVIFIMAALKVRSLERGDRLFWERRSLLVIGGDLVMIGLAYFGAYFLRLGFRIEEPIWTAVVKAFPIVFVVRTACFFWFGLYRGLWKYTSTPDVLRIVKSVAVGSAVILTLVVLFYRFVAFPRSLFIIEFVLLIVMLGGSRFASRLFHEFGKEALGANPKRVAIVGAGDYGDYVGRQIRESRGHSVSIACYIDDDKNKHGLVLRGVPIVGPTHDLASICDRFDVDELVLGIRDLPDTTLKRILSDARTAGVPLEGDGPRPAIVELERVAAALGREQVRDPSAQTRAYFEGKRVLLTHGGLDIGPALTAELIACGARVTVHVESILDAKRFDGINGAGMQLVTGGFERELDATRVLNIADPHVVFHCASLDSAGVSNAGDHLWRSVVRSTRTLSRVVSKYPVESLVAVTLFGRADELAIRFAALRDVLLLNGAELAARTPKVIRLPEVLTRDGLGRITAGVSGRGAYGLLEPEAIAICLEAAATYKGRAILAPRRPVPMTEGEIARTLGVAESRTSEVRTTIDITHAGEELKASLIAGAREVVSPLYPADADVLDIATRCADAPSFEEAREAADRFTSAMRLQERLS